MSNDRDRGSQPSGSPDRVTIEPAGFHFSRGEPADGDIGLASVAAMTDFRDAIQNSHRTIPG
jgi:hypothetical protein